MNNSSYMYHAFITTVIALSLGNGEGAEREQVAPQPFSESPAANAAEAQEWSSMWPASAMSSLSAVVF